MFFDNFRCNASWEVKWDRPETCPESHHIFVVGFCSNTTTPTAPHHNRTSTQQFLRGDQRSVTLTWLLEHWEFWQITGRATRPLWAAQADTTVQWDQSSKIISPEMPWPLSEHEARDLGAVSRHPIGSQLWTGLMDKSSDHVHYKVYLHSLIFCLADTSYWHVGTEACIRKSCA